MPSEQQAARRTQSTRNAPFAKCATDIEAQAGTCHPRLVARSGVGYEVSLQAPVAQLDRVTVSEAVGRWFESNRARQLTIDEAKSFLGPAFGFFVRLDTAVPIPSTSKTGMGGTARSGMACMAVVSCT